MFQLIGTLGQSIGSLKQSILNAQNGKMDINTVPFIKTISQSFMNNVYIDLIDWVNVLIDWKTHNFVQNILRIQLAALQK